MESIKIRNFYGLRILEQIHKARNFISKITYNSPIYNKLEFDEIPQNLKFFPPNFWKSNIERGNLFFKKKKLSYKKHKGRLLFLLSFI